MYAQSAPAPFDDPGYSVHVKNAGKPFGTLWGLLRRLDPAVPSGTKIVILATKGLYNNNQVPQLKADEVMNRRAAVEEASECQEGAMDFVISNSMLGDQEPQMARLRQVLRFSTIFRDL